jgi:uncharacterized membrane protein
MNKIKLILSKVNFNSVMLFVIAISFASIAITFLVLCNIIISNLGIGMEILDYYASFYLGFR